MIRKNVVLLSFITLILLTATACLTQVNIYYLRKQVKMAHSYIEELQSSNANLKAQLNASDYELTLMQDEIAELKK